MQSCNGSSINRQESAKAAEPLGFTRGQTNRRRSEGVINHIGQPCIDRLIDQRVPFDDEVAVGRNPAISEPINEQQIGGFGCKLRVPGNLVSPQ